MRVNSISRFWATRPLPIDPEHVRRHTRAEALPQQEPRAFL